MSKQQGPMDLELLRGSIAVVTGAGNNGIGWGLCCYAAEALGMHVVAIDLHEKLVVAAQERLRARYPRVQCFGLVCDVTKSEALMSCVEQIQALLPDKSIGAVFANAGVIFSSSVMRSKASEWVTTLNVNVVGVVNTIQAFVPVLQEQKSPSVFSATASIGGLVRGDNGGASYQASKHAVVAICESLSFELAIKSPQIRVHVLCPCIVASGLNKTSVTNLEVAEGKLASVDVAPAESLGFLYAMTPERHAAQTFEHIASGNFYMVTDNVRPYVDHDRPFDGLGIVRERYENMLQLTIDNSDAWLDRVPRSSIMKGPMFTGDSKK